MKIVLSTFVMLAAFALPIAAQNGEGNAQKKAVAEASAEKAQAKVVLSQAGRAALAAAKEVAARTRGLRGPERAQALEAAATAYDKVIAGFTAEAPVAAIAAITAADLWRQQGSLPIAEKDYLLAAQLDGPRYGQRALLGVADMQRRQKRTDEALATYQKVAAIDPSSARAHEARLWQARLLQGSERIDDAILAFQAALESADAGAQTTETCNFLALALLDKGDLDAAGRAIEHAEQSVTSLEEEDPIVQERLKKGLESMSAKKALQRLRDKQNGVGKDAAGLEEGRAGK